LKDALRFIIGNLPEDDALEIAEISLRKGQLEYLLETGEISD
jgi:hypothetical protein